MERREWRVESRQRRKPEVGDFFTALSDDRFQMTTFHLKKKKKGVLYFGSFRLNCVADRPKHPDTQTADLGASQRLVSGFNGFDSFAY